MITTAIPTAANSATEEQIHAIFAAQQAYAPVVARSTARERKAKLRRLLEYLEARIPEVAETMRLDQGAEETESLLIESMPARMETHFVLRHIDAWMAPQRVPTPITLMGTSSYIQYEPKGVCLIISPWNYPYTLTIRPLISAIAAGNTVIIKPSEYAPHASAFMRDMVQALFKPEEIAVVEGDAGISQRLLQLPFNHIFFTGSPSVGKAVMKAASEHLSSVTLELGGKSPSIITEHADIDLAASHIAWSKHIKSGQSCVATDYVLVHESVAEAFIQRYIHHALSMFEDGLAKGEAYGRSVNARHFARVEGILQDALSQGAQVRLGGKTLPEELKIAHTVLTGVKPEMRIMQEEIFGPLMPVLTYRDPEEAVRITQAAPHPLALYIFSRREPEIRFFKSRILSGDLVVNHCVVHHGNPNLPFGGTNNSGIGKSIGHAGFKEFSHPRSVMINHWFLSRLIYPPYTSAWKRRIAKLFYRLN
ncbi:MAG: aldehyde dehydrogenase family protein [Bacteroidia bacterium]|nr:aldehyde dehydrogenase family protein [Bacteroidia bacterium]